MRTICSKSGEPIEASSLEHEAEILSPGKTVCEPPADCLHCKRQNFCQQFHLFRSDVKELEARLEAERNVQESEAEEKTDS